MSLVCIGGRGIARVAISIVLFVILVIVWRVFVIVGSYAYSVSVSALVRKVIKAVITIYCYRSYNTTVCGLFWKGHPILKQNPLSQ